jgi:hypothetical protein
MKTVFRPTAPTVLWPIVKSILLFVLLILRQLPKNIDAFSNNVDNASMSCGLSDTFLRSPITK